MREELVSLRYEAAYDQVVGGGGSKILRATALSKERKEEKSRTLYQIRKREKERRKRDEEREPGVRRQPVTNLTLNQLT